MRQNLKNYNRKEITWLEENRCKVHGHTYLEHISCYRREHPYERPGEIPERIGMLDIEATALNASFGYCFSWAIKELDGKIYGRVLTSEEIKTYQFDKELMREFCKIVREFDRLVVHYGADHRFDIPFLRSRCLLYNLDFPLNKEIYVDDTWMISRNKLKLHSNRLEAICQFLNIPAKQHKLEPRIWEKALAGHTPSLKYIWMHNKEDVCSLEAVWKRLNEYVGKVKRSI